MSSVNVWLLVLALTLTNFITVDAADPDITTDFVVPKGVTADAEFFTFRGLRNELWAAPTNGFTVTKASQEEFRGLTGLGVSLAVLKFAPSSVNTPHTHPRASELLLVLQGCLSVGFVDPTNNKLFTQTLQTGDAFVFPKGLVHFQANNDQVYPAVAVSGFGSANAGTISLAKTLFGTAIDAGVLAKSFKTDEETIKNLVYAASN